MSLLSAMCAGADSIDDADRLRHGAMDRAFAGVRAPSTLGTLASVFHAKATIATLRTHLVHVPARLARTARIKLTAHLPVN